MSLMMLRHRQPNRIRVVFLRRYNKRPPTFPINFLVDEATSDEAAFVDSDEITDSFDPNDHTDEHTQIDDDPFEESCNTLEVEEE